jgi:hypothetical protein
MLPLQAHMVATMIGTEVSGGFLEFYKDYNQPELDDYGDLLDAFEDTGLHTLDVSGTDWEPRFHPTLDIPKDQCVVQHLILYEATQIDGADETDIMIYRSESTSTQIHHDIIQEQTATNTIRISRGYPVIGSTPAIYRFLYNSEGQVSSIQPYLA